MDDSIAHPPLKAGAWELSAWKSWSSHISAVLLAIVMLVAGVWKITNLLEASTRMNQALVPADLSLLAAISFGVAETFSGVLLLVPRFRRWGAWLSGLLLVSFLIYIGANYPRLVGDECNCFPWIERAVGPGFFIGDGIMLLWAIVAGIWSRPSTSIKGAAVVLAAVAVFAAVSFGLEMTQTGGTMAPETILVNGEPTSIHDGKVLLYFFDPECTSCLFAAREMSGYNWNNTQIVAIPTRQAEYADQFMEAAGLQAPLSSDAAKLREVFEFGDPPFGVALENGREVTTLRVFEENDEPAATLRSAGFIE